MFLVNRLLWPLFTITLIILILFSLPHVQSAPSPKGTDPYRISSICYFAEGSTAWGFETSFVVTNPYDEEREIEIECITSSGESFRRKETIQKGPNEITLPQGLGEADFSTIIRSLDGKNIVADRWMGLEPVYKVGGDIIYDCHGSTSISSPSKTWYFAEGSTSWGFSSWLLVLNPTESNANIDITFFTDEGNRISIKETIPQRTRGTFNLGKYVKDEDFSFMLSSDTPVVAERSMYRQTGSATNSFGLHEPSRYLYLAEGSTAWGFKTFLLLGNPNEEQAQVSLSFHTSQGPARGLSFDIPPFSRKTICLNDHINGFDFSTAISSSVPIVAERAMYKVPEDSVPGIEEFGTLSSAVTSPHSSLCFASAFDTLNNDNSWLLVDNPNDKNVEISVTYITNGGRETYTRKFTDKIPAFTRRSYKIQVEGLGSVYIESNSPGLGIIAEKTWYKFDGLIELSNPLEMNNGATYSSSWEK